MKKIRFKIFFITALAALGVVLIPAVCFAQTSTGAAVPVKDLKKNVSEKMETVGALSFNFTQNTLMGGSTRTVAAGVHFRRPENLILNYTEPDVQQIYISSDTVYTYIPSIEQATSQKRNPGEMANIAGVTLSVIFSPEPFKYLQKDFELEAYELDSYIKLEAVPVSPANYDKMEIYFSKDDYYPARTVVSAPNFRSVTVFSDYRANRDYQKDFFRFNPGGDVNLIEIQ